MANVVKRLSATQAVSAGTAVAVLISLFWDGWVDARGGYPPKLGSVGGAALSSIMVTIFLWAFTSEEIVDATTVQTTTGDTAVLVAPAVAVPPTGGLPIFPPVTAPVTVGPVSARL